VVEAPASAATPSPVRWTPRAYALLALGGGFAALGVALRNPVPLFAGIPFLIAPFLAGSFVARQLPRADLDWQAEGLGPDVRVSGTLRGEFGRSAVDVSIAVPTPPGVSLTEPLQFERGPTAIRFHCGWRFSEPAVVTVPPPTVVWRESLGLSERTVEGDCPSLPIERFPPPPHRLGAIRLERTTPLPGEVRSRLLGASGEFFGLREAMPNEPPRSVNWRATARVGRPLANDYRLDRTGDLLIVLDLRPTSLGPVYDERLLGVARAAVHGIAETFLQNKTRIGFASFGEFLRAVPLSTGRAHRLRLLRAIVATRLASVAGPAERCAVELRRLFPPGVTTLVVSSWTDDPWFNLVPYVRRQGFPVILLCPSPLGMRARTGGLAPEDEPLAERMERLERRVRLAELWVHGPVVDWEDFWTLDPLARILRRPSYRRFA